MSAPNTAAQESGLKQAAAATGKTPEQLKLERRKELLAKVRQIRAHALTDRGKVLNGKPDKAYIWSNIAEHTLVEFQGLGYQICKDPDVKTAWKKEDGTHVRGDLILMEVDRDLYDAIKADDELRALEAIEAPKNAFAATVARERAGEVYEPRPRG